MPYGDSLPRFDPTIHLVSSDLRALENKSKYGDLPGTLKEIGPQGASGSKIAKAAYETRLLTQVCTTLPQMSAEHPPYGLIAPVKDPQKIISLDAQQCDARFLTTRETQLILREGALKTVHALSDLKIQIILNDLFRDIQESEDFLKLKPAGDKYASDITDGLAVSWKQVVQSAASNAKRSEFIILKQIIIQCLRTMNCLPTREEFLQIAKNSQSLLEILATTHQSIFKILNARIIHDERLGLRHSLVTKYGEPQIVLKKTIVDNLKIERGQPKVRTMCAALLAKDENGISLLEHSYKEDSHIVADMLYEGNEPKPERFEAIANETMPDTAVLMFLKLPLIN